MSFTTVALHPTGKIFLRRKHFELCVRRSGEKSCHRDVRLQSVGTRVTQLESLKSMTLVSSDTGEVDKIKKYGPSDSTTNPTLILRAIQKPEYERFVRQAIKEESSNPGPYMEGRPFASWHLHQHLMERSDFIALDIADRVAVLMGCALLDVIPGKVSTQVDPHFSFDTNTTVSRTLHLMDLYREKGIDLERVYIKTAATWEGIKACELLKEKGISCNMTLVLSLIQAAACGHLGAAMIAAYVGRILEWYKIKTGKMYTAEQDPGVLSLHEIYAYFKTHDIKTKIMAASFRNVDEIRQLSGCDYITISPEHMEALQQSYAQLPRILEPDMYKDTIPKPLNALDEESFKNEISSNLMATDLLKSGIANFSAHQREIEDIIKSFVS